MTVTAEIPAASLSKKPVCITWKTHSSEMNSEVFSYFYMLN